MTKCALNINGSKKQKNLNYQCVPTPLNLIINFFMSDRHRSPNNSDNEEDSGFYQKSEHSSDQPNQADKIPSKADAFKNKPIHKRGRGRGHTKPKNSKQEEIDRKIQEKAQEEAEQIIIEMEKRYDEDLKMLEKKRPASRKLTYLSTLKERLKHVVVWDKFLQQSGLQQFELWFTKLPSGIEPSLTLRKGLLELLDSLRIKAEHISRVSSIQRIVQKHKKSQTKELRDLSESILLKWSRTLHEEEIEG